jgi:hypothetical protein
LLAEKEKANLGLQEQIKEGVARLEEARKQFERLNKARKDQQGQEDKLLGEKDKLQKRVREL